MKVVLLCFLLIQMVLPQVQVWYQKQTGNIGAAMSVAVSAQGMIYASVYNKGIYRSLDSGGTWSQIAPYTDGVWSVALRNNGEIVAGLWSRGVFRSTDHGSTWTETVSNRLHADVRAVNSLDEIIIEAEGKLLRTTDNGAEWIETSVGGTAVAVSGDTVYAAKGSSIFRSVDNGETWSNHSTLSTPSYSLLAERNGTLIAGGYCSETSAAPSIHTYDTLSQTWSSGGPRTTINALLRRHDGMLFAASHDSGFYYSLDHGAVWRQHNNGLSTTKIYSLALLNDTVIIAGTLDGIFFTRGLNTILSVEKEKPKPKQVLVPVKLTLKQNYPNPFNPSTTISYSIPVSGYTSLHVYDLLGRKVSQLVEEMQNPGEYSIILDASLLSSGMYLYSLRNGNSTITKRMLLVR
jgi:photosystem II stability/assembly factor-like uncharacterized protein